MPANEGAASKAQSRARMTVLGCFFMQGPPVVRGDDTAAPRHGAHGTGGRAATAAQMLLHRRPARTGGSMDNSAIQRSWWMVPLALAFCAGGAWAQASFIESFDDNGATATGQYGPANLIARGWTFRMQSSPASSQVFFDGYHGSDWPTPQAGPGYLGADGFMSSSSGPVSHWAILPVIPNQVAGDMVTLHVRRHGALPARLEVRYSPSGGTSTGSGPTAVGDFTQLLVSSDPIPTGGWLAYSAAVPGGGRIALRFAGQFQAFSGGLYSGIDTLSVGAPPPP